MARERCLKKAFQDSLEDIKERMKEKRSKKLAKVATVNKTLCTKSRIISSSQSSATLKAFQDNNKDLALALQAEKCKTRQAQDLILHLKSEHQKLMFQIIFLKKKLSLQQASSQAEVKLASLKDIIAKVTHNLLDTANLLGPAHALCSSNHGSVGTPQAMEDKGSTPTGISNRLGQAQHPASANGREASCSKPESCSVPERINPNEEPLEKRNNGPSVKRSSKGRKPSLNRRFSDDEGSDTEASEDTSYLKNVSMRRRASSLNVCIEESSMENNTLNSMIEAPMPENLSPVKDCPEKSLNVCPQSPSNDEILPFTKVSEISSSTPEPQPKEVSKSKSEMRPGRERARKGKAEGVSCSQLKKPWEKAKPRTRSKSRERGASKPAGPKDKLNSSLNSGDAYDFFCEESIHVTPFRPSKPSEAPEEEKGSEEEEPDTSSSSAEELDDSLYVPSKPKNRGSGPASLPLRPRSKRSKAPQQQMSEKLEIDVRDHPKKDLTKVKRHPKPTKGDERSDPRFSGATKGGQVNKENAQVTCAVKEEQAMDIHVVGDGFLFPEDKNIYESEVPAPRISLSDVTNFSSCSGKNEAKKHSFPFHDAERKRSETSLRKRRCTVTVNYAEPSLHKKLRRGDPFTDTEFLSSPIFKGNEQTKRKSLNRKSLARYNEAFVGCGR